MRKLLIFLLFVLVSCNAPETAQVQTPVVVQEIPLQPTIPFSPTITSSPTETQLVSTTPVPPVPTNTPIPSRQLPTATLPTTIDLLPVASGKIAFVYLGRNINRGIYLINTDGSDMQFLIEAIPAIYLSWSPDGHRIAYDAVVHDRDGDQNIYTIKPDGSDFQRITSSPKGNVLASWSPDGKQMVYMEGGDPTNLAVVDVDSGNTRKLTYTPGYEMFPIWSPNGKQIAFLYREDKTADEAELWIMDTDGRNRERIAEFPIGLRQIAWSPNGRQIVFSSPTNCGNIYVVDVNGGNPTQITNVAGCANNPSWSPDGRHIAFLASEKKQGDYFSRGWQIYIMNADGSSTTQLTTFQENAPGNVAWSPVPALVIGSSYAITEAGDYLNLREAASLDSPKLGQIRTGEVVTVLEGPVDSDDYYWWRIRTSDGLEGWVVEMVGWYTRSE